MESHAKTAQLNRCIDESSDSDDNPIAINPNKKFNKSKVTINDMPDDILYELFKYFSPIERNKIIKNVSLRWQNIALHPLFWRTFVVPKQVLYIDDQHSICDVLRVAGNNLLELTLTGRYDGDVILEQVARYNTNLRSLTMSRCRGRLLNYYIKAHVMKNVLMKLPKIQTFHLHQTHCRSLKFFELFGSRRYVEHSDNLPKSKVNSITYTGRITYEQLLAYEKTAAMTSKITLDDGKEYSIKKVRTILEENSYNPKAFFGSLKSY